MVDRGKPQPNITWFKDGSALPKGIQLLNNGTTILFQNTTTDLQAKVDGHPEIGGNYTCIATNPSGSVAASSIVIPFGGKHKCFNTLSNSFDYTFLTVPWHRHFTKGFANALNASSRRALSKHSHSSI